ncbi:dimethylarginine dimethylaminohydrolase family protein [Chloroflexota bacterium]
MVYSYEQRLQEIPLYRPGKPPLTYFDSDFGDELEKTWGRNWGSQSSYAKLRCVVVHRPGPEAAFGDVDPDFLNLPSGLVNLERMQAQHDEFTRVLQDNDVETVPLYAPQPMHGTYGIPLRSATFCHETLMVKGGAIICRCAPAYKRGLEYYHSRTLGALGCPILCTVSGRGFFESSNAVWLDKSSLPLALSQRSNMEGVNQVAAVLHQFGVDDTHIVHLPGPLNTRRAQTGGGGGAFHLDMVFGVAGDKLGVIYPQGVGYDFIDYLLHTKGFDLIEIPEEEVNGCPSNLLVLEPGRLIMPAGNPSVSGELKKRGMEVIEVDLSEFTNAGGGPTCMTIPLVRDEEA